MPARRRRHAIVHAVAIGTLTVTAVGCRGGAPEGTSDDARSPASDVAAPSPTPRVEAARTTTSPTPPSPASTSNAPTTPATPSTSPTPSATPPTDDDALPPQAPAEHGGSAVAVYLAVTDEGYDAPPVQQAQAVADDLGYEAGAADLGCDRGAAEALGYETGAGQTWVAVALYFATHEQAVQVRAAVEAAGHPVEGVADVTTYCLD